MGYESRKNGGLVDPSQDRTLHIGEVSKLQLAKALNEQTQRFQAMREQLQTAMLVLTAIVLEPEAFEYAHGVRVKAGALAKVVSGMSIRLVRTREGDMTLALEQDPPRITVPTILMPGGQS